MRRPAGERRRGAPDILYTDSLALHGGTRIFERFSAPNAFLPPPSAARNLTYPAHSPIAHVEA
jgi:hypothetical protein